MSNTPLPYQDALSLIETVITPLPVRDVSWRNLEGCTLAEDIHAAEDVPLYDNSAMDGFAIQAQDTEFATDQSPVSLKRIENIYADKCFPQHEVSSGQCSKIMTGAPVPKGADAVIMVEKTTCHEQSIDIFLRVHAKENIRKKAEEIRKGQVILPKGIRIGSAEFGLIASQGITAIRARNNPTVAVMPTGNELVEPDEKTEEAQIRNINGYTLECELATMGCNTVRLGIGKDDPDSLKQQIIDGMEQADVLLTSGGVSMGDKDFLPAVIKELGMNIHFHKVAIKPGKPLLFAEWNGKYLFGLPGNIVSTLASYHLFVKPALRLLSGRKEWKNPVHYARSGIAVKNSGNRMNFIRCCLSQTPTGLPLALPTGKQGSGMLSSMVGADGFMVIPADVDTVEEHQVLEFIPIVRH